MTSTHGAGNLARAGAPGDTRRVAPAERRHRVRRGIRLAVAAATVCLAVRPAAAQTNDRVFRSWRWPQESTAARAAGWGGVAVAVPDDAAAADVNPAGLGTLAKSTVFGGAVAFGSGRAPVGDETAARRTLGLTGVALRFSSRLTLGLSVTQPRVARIELAPVRLADGSTDAGTLVVRTLDAAVSAAWRLRPHLQVGARLVNSRLSLSADARHDPATGPTDLRLTSSGAPTRVTAGVGIMYAPGARLTLGFASQAGIAYPLTRRAESPLLGVELDPGSGYELRRPSVLSAGAHLRLSPRFAVAGQVDYVRWSEVPAGLVIAVGARSRDEYHLGDALEPRAGAEYSLALSRASIQVRAGLHAHAPGGLRFEGDDAAERSAFPGSSWKLGGAVGVSVVTSRLHVDLSGSFGGERPQLLAGAGMRF